MKPDDPEIIFKLIAARGREAYKNPSLMKDALCVAMAVSRQKYKHSFQALMKEAPRRLWRRAFEGLIKPSTARTYMRSLRALDRWLDTL